MWQIKFQNEYYYHIYNRGVDKRDVFMDQKDYLRFLTSLREFNCMHQVISLHQLLVNRDKKPSHALAKAYDGLDDSLVSIIAYCLLPNHYHLLLKQKSEIGISKFMHKVSMGYTNYTNFKYKRSGSLFQGRFKSVPIKTDAQLLYISAYINGNPEIHKIAKADKWPWSSYQEYLGAKPNPSNAFIKALDGLGVLKSVILKEFENIKNYQDYVIEVIENSSEIKEEIKKCLLE